jgi:transglutaminase-like putative cysteine protease
VIDKPIAGVKTDARPHPAGGAGARLSLKEVAERAWKARMSPRIRAWSTQVLAAANVSGGGRRQKAKAILDAFRKKVPYIADPVMGEFMATPEQTLCLDDGGLCFIGGDCDDHSIGLAAAMMSLGIPAMIIGSSHREPHDVPTHVYMAFEDDMGDWVRMDGTTRLAVGHAAPHTREFWVEPGAEAKEKGEGDFVGMSGHDGMLGGAPSTMIDLLFPNFR